MPAAAVIPAPIGECFSIFQLLRLALFFGTFLNFQLKNFCYVLRKFPYFTNLSACSIDVQLLSFWGVCGLLLGSGLGLGFWLGFRLGFRLRLGLGFVLGLGLGLGLLLGLGLRLGLGLG